MLNHDHKTSYGTNYERGEAIMKVYGYVRVSTIAQSKAKRAKGPLTEEEKIERKEAISNSFKDQELQLRQAGATEIVLEAMSGKNSERPELRKIIDQMEKYDQLIVIKLDRLSRSAVGGQLLIDEILAKGCTIEVLNMGKFDSTPMGDLARTMMLERTSAGKAIARLNPEYKEGRPREYEGKIEDVKHRLSLDQSIRKISKDLTIPYSSCKRMVDRIRRDELPEDELQETEPQEIEVKGTDVKKIETYNADKTKKEETKEVKVMNLLNLGYSIRKISLELDIPYSSCNRLVDKLKGGKTIEHRRETR